MDSKALPWQTSSYSMGNGACVEVAKTRTSAHFRDMKDRGRGASAVVPGPWDEFLSAGGHARRLTAQPGPGHSCIGWRRAGACAGRCGLPSRPGPAWGATLITCPRKRFLADLAITVII
ncbi:DUF397 domain-containing protein [Streptomyces sp. BBFR109]|uniref:DUF397 domain-containing protein n=1 Tax=Streptomyces sp. BBFR109 TaxID=3448172 RepID=UPI003F75B8E8